MGTGTYTKQTWTNDDPTTPVNDTRLAHIEEGVRKASLFAEDSFKGVWSYLQNSNNPKALAHGGTAQSIIYNNTPVVNGLAFTYDAPTGEWSTTKAGLYSGFVRVACGNGATDAHINSKGIYTLDATWTPISANYDAEYTDSKYLAKSGAGSDTLGVFAFALPIMAIPSGSFSLIINHSFIADDAATDLDVRTIRTMLYYLGPTGS